MINGPQAHRAGEHVADKYLLLRSLDQRGAGSVWVAHHVALDVHVAIKLARAPIDSTDGAARLIQEAQAAARVRHPAIVSVLDVGRASSGEAYLAMELLEGELLSEVLAREGRLEPLTAVRLLVPVVEAVGALHRQGVIHRDLRPENIFLSCSEGRAWQAKLIDFGQARCATQVSRLSRNKLMCMPLYMSPERLRGIETDDREDLWGLAVVLYRMITGHLPFDGVDASHVLSAQLRDEPRQPQDHGIDDPGLSAIALRGLKSAPEERWASADALRAALTEWMEARQQAREGAPGLELDRVATHGAPLVEEWWVPMTTLALPRADDAGLTPAQQLLAAPLVAPVGAPFGARKPSSRSAARWCVFAVAVGASALGILITTSESPRAPERPTPQSGADHGAPPPLTGGTSEPAGRRDDPSGASPPAPRAEGVRK